VIPNAPLSLINSRTREALHTTTNEAGEFLLGAVEPGPYELSAEFFAFDTYRLRLLITDTTNEINITLDYRRCPDPVKRLTDKARRRQAPFCSIHRKRLLLGVVPIEYGLVIAVAVEEFQNSNWVYCGGCVADCYRKAEIFYCPYCRKAELKKRRAETIVSEKLLVKIKRQRLHN
jgi:hypothetical protein